MSIAQKYNKVGKFVFKVPKDFPYMKLRELYERYGEESFEVKALYIGTKGHFGESGVIATENCLVNLPMHLTPTIKEMLNDDSVIVAINAGKLGFQIYEYEEKDTGKNYYSINWVDM